MEGHNHYQHDLEARAGLIDETLLLASYSAVTHVLVAYAIAYFFWDCASHAYLVGLAATVSFFVAVTVGFALRFKTAFKKVVNERMVRHAFLAAKILAFALGTTWATMPALLIPPSDSGHRLIAVATAAGLISDAFSIGPILSVALLLTLPTVVGAYIGLLRSEQPIGTYVSVLLTIYVTFIFFSIRLTSKQAYQRLRDRIVIKEQTQTIGLLLNEYEEEASDWLWETDCDGHLRHVPPRMASALSVPASQLEGRPLEALLRAHLMSDAGEQPVNDLAEALAKRRSFQDCALRLMTADGTRWWSLNGRPFFDKGGDFAGFRGVGSDITASQTAEEHITFLATHDTLTGLPNRGAFQTAIQQICGSSDPHQQTFSLIYLDLDGFKAVNDSEGHGTGDLLLKAVATRLLEFAGEGVHICRLGGDEFAIFYPCSAKADAEVLADEIIKALRAPYKLANRHIEIGTSVGIAYFPHDATEPTALLSKADLALYDAKTAGRGRWRNFDVALEARVGRRRQLDVDMRRALGAGELSLYYQPLVAIENEQVVGFEALLRWCQQDGSWISPSEIVAIAESTGFIVDIGHWALRAACRDARAWQNMRVAVNISTVQFRMPSFVDDVVQVLEDTGLEPERLEIEITESILLEQNDIVMANLSRLRDLGVRVALDDFGTGYSSLRYLTQFPFDKIKIDRSFVQSLQLKPESLAVVEAITLMAHALSMEVTAEGVETREEYELLKQKRCNFAQGFLYSPARPAREIPGLVACINERGGAGTIAFTQAAE